MLCYSSHSHPDVLERLPERCFITYKERVKGTLISIKLNTLGSGCYINFTPANHQQLSYSSVARRLTRFSRMRLRGKHGWTSLTGLCVASLPAVTTLKVARLSLTVAFGEQSLDVVLFDCQSVHLVISAGFPVSSGDPIFLRI